MIEVRIENKNPGHVLNVKGKLMDFIEGSIFVTEDEAQFIKELKDPQYKIITPKPEKVKKQTKPKATPKPKKKVIKKE